MDTRRKYFKSSRLLIFSLILINLGITLISYWYYEVEKEAFVSQKVKQIQSIADIKLTQIIDWKNERLSDANYLAVSPNVSESFERLSSDRANDLHRRSMYDNLFGMFLNGKYESMVAVDSSGQNFFTIPEDDKAISKYFLHGSDTLRDISGIQLGDMFLDSLDMAVMQIIIPKTMIKGVDTIFLGWLALNINLNESFLPLLESIPIPSNSLQVSLIKRKNNKIIFLTGSGMAGKIVPEFETFRSESLLPLFNFNSDFKGIETGRDTRGTSVLAATLPIPGSKAILLVKMNKSEVYFEVRKLKHSMIAFTSFMILAFTSAISFFWLRQRSEMQTLEIEKKMLTERFDVLSKFANDAIIVYTNDLTILQVNDKALELYGYTRDEILGMSADLLRSPDLRGELDATLETTIKEGGFRFETINIRKDETKFPAEVSLRYMELLGSPCFQEIVRDITQRKQFERALITSEERLKLITNTMPQIVWTAKPDGTFDFFNSRFEVLTGLNPLKETSVNAFIHEEDRERVITYWKEATQNIKEHQIRFRLRMKDGAYRWFLCIAIPLCEKGKDLIRWYGSATDIDELENTVAQRTAELSDLYNNAPCGYHSLDINGTFLNINDTALKWLGYSREELIDRKNFADVITEESREAFIKNFSFIKSEGFADNLEYDLVKKDGTLLPALLSATIVRDGNGNIIMTRNTMIDHTVRKRHENEILKLNTILQEHGYNLEYTNKELEAFIFSVSHDLRAPLRAINGFSRILLDEYNTQLDEEGQKMLEKVWGNANRMRQLIDDLLRLSRAGRHELSYASIDMGALFNSMIEETKQLFPEKIMHVTVNSIPGAYGDLALLKQVISNLLSNAVKFSGNKEISEIEIGSVMGEKELTYYIKDNGTGFDMKFAHELFGVFRRLNNAEDYEGTGVGLALVKRIIDKHGGRVWAYSEPDRGATFYFSLPRNNIA